MNNDDEIVKICKVEYKMSDLKNAKCAEECDDIGDYDEHSYGVYSVYVWKCKIYNVPDVNGVCHKLEFITTTPFSVNVNKPKDFEVDEYYYEEHEIHEQFGNKILESYCEISEMYPDSSEMEECANKWQNWLVEKFGNKEEDKYGDDDEIVEFCDVEYHTTDLNNAKCVEELDGIRECKESSNGVYDAYVWKSKIYNVPDVYGVYRRLRFVTKVPFSVDVNDPDYYVVDRHDYFFGESVVYYKVEENKTLKAHPDFPEMYPDKYEMEECANKWQKLLVEKFGNKNDKE